MRLRTDHVAYRPRHDGHIPSILYIIGVSKTPLPIMRIQDCVEAWIGHIYGLSYSLDRVKCDQLHPSDSAVVL